MQSTARRVVAVAALLLVASRIAAQGRGEVELSRLAAPIRIDGNLADSAWIGVVPLAVTMHRPAFRGTPTERTEIRIGYDDQYLYAAGWFYDSDPSRIRANTLYRDRYSGDDTFALFIDPFNDNESGLWFAVNPAGARVDRSMSNDARTFNDSWNAPWDAAARITGEGWFAELRIPLSVLGFQSRGGRVVMGLTVTRLIARINERMTWPEIDPRYEFRQPSVMQDVVLRDVAARRPVYLSPYLLSGFDRTLALPPGGTGYVGRTGFVREAGADLRYDPSDNLHFDLSVNTDFAQVEADDEQLNLTRFPLFFPEKRQFFQERSGLFDFDFGAGGTLFHSRQIGLAHDRTPIRLLGGARVVARAGAWDIAALDAQTARRGEIPAENLAVARIKRQVLNPLSFAGAMVTSRIDDRGSHNVALGSDLSVRVFGNDHLTVRAAGTFDDSAGGSLLDRSQLHAQWQRRSSRGFNYNAQLHRVGSAYRPELGFLPREDFTRVSMFSEYHILPERSPLRSHGPGAIAYLFFRNADRALETYYLAYWWLYELRSGANGWLEVIHHYEDVPVPFELGDGVSVAPGAHKFTELWLNYQPASGSLFRTGVDARIGGFYDGWRGRIEILPTWNISRHLEVGGSYELNRIRFPDRGTGLDAHIGRFRIGVAANARLSATGLLQVNSVTDRLSTNFRLRYNFREGSDLWLVYDEGFNIDRVPEPGLPRRPLSDVRVLRLKLTHTFVP